MADEKILVSHNPVFELLSEADVQKIIDAIFQLLRETGVAFDPDPRVLDRFSDAGCDISSDHTVRFETDLVKECLDTVAKSTRIWNRDGTGYMEAAEGATSVAAETEPAQSSEAASTGSTDPDGEGDTTGVR